MDPTDRNQDSGDANQLPVDERPLPASTRLTATQAFGKAFRVVAMLCLLGLFALVMIKYSPFNPVNVPVGENHPAVGKQIASLNLVPLTGDGKEVGPGALAGRVTLINFWGTWCPPCRQEFPHLRDLFERWRSNADFQFLSVSCGAGGLEDMEELRSTTAAFMEKMAADFPTYADPTLETRREIDRLAGFQGYPTTLLVDRTGTIRAMWVGYWSGLETEIERALQKVFNDGTNPASNSGS